MDASAGDQARMVRPGVLLMALILLLGVSGCSGLLATDSESAAEPIEETEDAEQDEPAEGTEAPADDAAAPGHWDTGVPAELGRVVDGDSLEVLIDGDETEIRLSGVNAPELFKLEGEGRSCIGEAAKQELELLVQDRDLAIVGEETDRFGRRLADVLVNDDGRIFSVGAALVAGGWGLAIGGDSPLRPSMMIAADAGLGMWGRQCGMPASTALSIGETQVDPAGRDRDNLDQEWVTIVNDGDTAVDLNGWVIRDDTTSNRFILEGQLGPGQQLTVRTGQGRNDENNLHLGETFPVWSNGGETVVLMDPDVVISAWAFIEPSGLRSKPVHPIEFPWLDNGV